MLFRKDSRGQGSTEYLLLYGAVIIIAIIALFIYLNYFGNPFSSTSNVTISITNNGESVTSSLRYEVYDKNGKPITPVGDNQQRLLSSNSNGTKNIGTFPKGSVLKLHESLSGAKSTLTTNIIITVYSNGMSIEDIPIIVTVEPGKHKGAPGNWYSITI